jgi:anti-anti-sigma factor
MDLSVRTYANVVVVLSAAGRIDHNSATEFEAELKPYLDDCVGDQGQIVLDLSGVDYMSSVGLRVLMIAAKQARKQQGKVVICGLGPTLREIFEISRFDQVFTLYDDVRTSLEMLSPEALGIYDSDPDGKPA